MQLALGFSHPVDYRAPAGIKLSAPQPTAIIVEGANKEVVGQVAAELRSLRPPSRTRGRASSTLVSRSAERRARPEASNGAHRDSQDARGEAARRHLRVRKKVAGTPERPRLVVYRSLKHIYAQLVDDVAQRTLATVSSQDGGRGQEDGEGDGGW